MMGDGDLENIILHTVERWWSGRYSEKHGIVTSYDPVKYLAKVKFQPGGQESDWLPIETGHIGNQYGIAVGLQPGDGQTTGDQVVVRYQEGDVEAGKIVQRVHSDNDKPPTVQSGELVVWTRFQKSDGGKESAQGGQGGTGQQIYFKNDGSATITDGNGATLVMDGNGNVKLTCNNLTITVNGNWISDIAKIVTMVAGGDIGLGAGGNAEISAGKITGLTGGASVNIQGGGSVSDGSVTPASGGSMQPPTTVTP
ncbi:hypothetical protein [Bradyrhizobium sp. Tv2a-2]|uniref:hypothetical protein n=1 Tax=Bradyrhizobium sp. Tv2a-2 TaxID=113395 RepID=UPI000421D7F7|nr:hypothetical protein [Bradyrhizobium sp. Tv2a-2]